jgi:hypothetical protein
MSTTFNLISIRARVAFAILCLENTIQHFKKENLEWSFIYKLLWSYTIGKVGSWHYPMAEATPRSILFDAKYDEKEMEFLNEDEYNQLKIIYSNSNELINTMINKIFEIGTRDLYSSIVNNSPDTINYLKEIIQLMEQNNIQLPDIKLFEKFPITENEGWGREFTRKDIFNEKI